MAKESKNYISSKDLEGLLSDRGLQLKRSKSQLTFYAPNGVVTFSRNKEIGLMSLVAIRQTLIAMGILSKQEFDSFVSQRSPLLGRVITGRSLKKFG